MALLSTVVSSETELMYRFGPEQIARWAGHSEGDNLTTGLAKRGTGRITAATQADPVVITSASHGLSTGDLIQISRIVGMTELNNRSFRVTVVDSNSFSLDDEDGSAHTAWTSGGVWFSFTEVIHQALNRANQELLSRLGNISGFTGTQLHIDWETELAGYNLASSRGNTPPKSIAAEVKQIRSYYELEKKEELRVSLEGPWEVVS